MTSLSSEQTRFDISFDKQPQAIKLGATSIQVYIYKGQVETASWHVPTSSIAYFKSPNSSVLHYLVDTSTGITNVANSFYTRRVDSFLGLKGVNVPAWGQVKALSQQCYQSMPMDHLLLDMRIHADGDVQVLSVDHQFELDAKEFH